MVERKRHLAKAVSWRVFGSFFSFLAAVAVSRSVTVGINDGDLMLGRFQSIIFAELDGPRTREISVQVLGE